MFIPHIVDKYMDATTSSFENHLSIGTKWKILPQISQILPGHLQFITRGTNLGDKEMEGLPIMSAAHHQVSADASGAGEYGWCCFAFLRNLV